MKYHFLLVFSVFAFTFGGNAQTRDDFRTWQTFSLKGDITKKLELNLDLESRFENNSRQVGRLFFEPGLKYKIKGETRVQLSYRWMRDNDQIWWGNRHRISLDFISGIEHRRWKHQFRLRFQGEKNGYGFLDHRYTQPELFSRQMLKSSYYLSRTLEPYVSLESRILMLDPRSKLSAGFDRFRFRIGTDYKISKALQAGVYFSLQQEFRRKTNDRIFVLGTELSWAIN
ncbi:MAG: DUF2490 domain-containing protein [Bacteroidetes bacterium]|nr:DUF2490 domain-containing protein [Bacteroidota bacterium]